MSTEDAALVDGAASQGDGRVGRIISRNASGSDLDFLRNGKVYTGHHRSATKLVASYLLEYLEESSESSVFFSTHATSNFSDLLQSIQSDDAQSEGLVLMNMTGAPLKGVREALIRDRSLYLAGVEASLLVAINEKFGSNLRPVTFDGLYEKGRDVPTVGSFAFLICSRDVPNFVILKILKILDHRRGDFGGETLGVQSPLDEYDFLSAFEKQYGGYLNDLLRNFFIFLVSVSVLTAAISVFGIWCISSYRRVGYFRRITAVYNMLPENTRLDDSEPPFQKPVIFSQQRGIISDIVAGVSVLIRVTQDVRRDYVTGGVMASHYDHVLDSVRYLKDLCQANLFQRLLEIIEAGNVRGVSRVLLRHYHTAGYISTVQYSRLLSCFEQGPVD